MDVKGEFPKGYWARMLRRKMIARKRPKKRLSVAARPEGCCWCGGSIDWKQGTYQTVFVHSVFDLEPKGGCVEFELASREKIIGTVGAIGSRIDNLGYDMAFVVCSEECGDRLEVALKQSSDALFREMGIKGGWQKR